MVDGPADPLGDVVRGAAPEGGQHFDRHQTRRGRHAGDAFSVAGALRDGAGDVGPVRMIVARIVVVADKVPPFDQALRIEIVDGIDAGVDDGDGHTLAAGGVPRTLRPDSLEMPLFREVRVVWDPEGVVADHRLRPDHVGARAELRKHLRLGARFDLQLDVVLGREDVAVQIVFLRLLVDHLAGHGGARAQLDLDQPGHGIGAHLHDRRRLPRTAGEPEQEQRHDGDRSDHQPLAQGRTRAESAPGHSWQHSLHPSPTRRRPRYFAERPGIIPDLHRARTGRRRAASRRPSCPPR